jgi:hypothetical protein
MVKAMVKDRKTLLNQITPLTLVNKINPPAHLQQKPYLRIIIAYIDKQVKLIKNLLYGTLREKMRICMNVGTKKLDNLRASHELEKLIELPTCRQQNTLNH